MPEPQKQPTSVGSQENSSAEMGSQTIDQDLREFFADVDPDRFLELLEASGFAIEVSKRQPLVVAWRFLQASAESVESFRHALTNLGQQDGAIVRELLDLGFRFLTQVDQHNDALDDSEHELIMRKREVRRLSERTDRFLEQRDETGDESS